MFEILEIVVNFKRVTYTLYVDLIEIGKHKITNKTLLNYFPASELWMPARHFPGNNRKIWGAKPISQPCPKHYIFASVSVGSWIVIIFLFAGLTGQYAGSQNS